MNQPYTNGHYETPLDISGVSLHRPPTAQKPTTFAPDLPIRGIAPLLYALQRFQLGGLAASRYLLLLWIIIGALAFLEVLPGQWITVSLAVILLVAQIALSVRIRQQQYVSFQGQPLPALTEAPLEINEKLTVYATGLLGVEGRYQRYSVLPGFYRTFATGEHALLCRVPERSWLALFSWPLEESGMWYAFIKPSDVRELTWGVLTFGATTLYAVALNYQLEIPPGPRRKRAELRNELLYIATVEQNAAQCIYVDLLNNLPSDHLSKTTIAH